MGHHPAGWRSTRDRGDWHGVHVLRIRFEHGPRLAAREGRRADPFGAGSAFHAGTAAASEGGTLSSAFATQDRAGQPGVDRGEEVSAMMNDNVRFRVLTQQVTNQISALRSVIAEMGRG